MRSLAAVPGFSQILGTIRPRQLLEAFEETYDLLIGGAVEAL